jgi:hypothetical protein
LEQKRLALPHLRPGTSKPIWSGEFEKIKQAISELWASPVDPQPVVKEMDAFSDSAVDILTPVTLYSATWETSTPVLG